MATRFCGIFSIMRERFALGGQISTLPATALGVIALVLAEGLAELLVDARHAEDRAVQHGRQAGAGERAENLLRFA